MSIYLQHKYLNKLFDVGFFLLGIPAYPLLCSRKKNNDEIRKQLKRYKVIYNMCTYQYLQSQFYIAFI